MKTILVAIIVALVVSVGTASAATPRPVQCFKAHHWIVKGTNRKGMAWPRPKNKYRYEQWSFYSDWSPQITLNVGLTRKQRRIVHLCLRA